MTRLLVFKEKIQKFYQRYTFIINPLIRFITGYIIFYAANRFIGYSPVLNKRLIEVLLACIQIVFPAQVMLFFAAVFIVAQVAYVSRYLAVTIAISFAILYFLYIRFLPEHGYVIMAMPVLFVFRIPYIMPLLLGLAGSPILIVPMGFGIIIYYLLSNVVSAISTATEDSVNLYKIVIQQLSADVEMYAVLAVFSVVLLIVCFVRNRRMSYAFESSIATGSILNVILFLILNYMIDINIEIGQMLLGTFVSGIIVLIVQFYKLPLNYAGVENLQFEDEEYYYYVRAVPKMNVTAASKRVKRFNAHRGYDTDGKSYLGTDDILEEKETIVPENKGIKPEHDFNFTVSINKDDLED